MKTAIKERPIIFSGEMVQAILAGRKTVTRRVVKPKWKLGPCDIREIGNGPEVYAAGGVWLPLECPYGEQGSRLWVREAWRRTCDTDAVCCVAYRADGAALHYLCDNGGEGDPTELAGPAGKLWDDDAAKWRPSIHMPRWASRITLEVKSVRVERLQDITEAEAIAEGFERDFRPDGTDYGCGLVHAVEGFAALWDQLNAGRGYAWESNPWVWRVEFERIVEPTKDDRGLA